MIEDEDFELISTSAAQLTTLRTTPLPATKACSPEVEKIARQICVNEGVDPDTASSSYVYGTIYPWTNWAQHIDAVEHWLMKGKIEKAARMVEDET